jgi:hypothetical protein
MKPAELRAVIVESTETGHTWRKVSHTGDIEPVTCPSSAVAWLEAHGYRQAGALIGLMPRVAVVWLKESDQPEYLESVLGERIVPGTACWARDEKKIRTTRTGGQIKRARRSLFNRGVYSSQDLAFVERPTAAAIAKCYGLVPSQVTG